MESRAKARGERSPQSQRRHDKLLSSLQHAAQELAKQEMSVATGPIDFGERIRKSELLQHFTASELGRLFRTTHQAIYRWGQFVPQHHVRRLLLKFPEWRKRAKPVFYNQFNKKPRGKRRDGASTPKR